MKIATRLQEIMPTLAKDFECYMNKSSEWGYDNVWDEIQSSFYFLSVNQQAGIVNLIRDAYASGKSEALFNKIKSLEIKYESMDSDGGRYKTAIDVLREDLV